MGYFPFFVDLTGKEGLIVGGGTVALRKVEKLLPYGPHLPVAAPEVLPELDSCPELTLLRRPFAPELLENKAFVIAATDDAAVNREISALCQERGIPVNVVDDPDQCTFLFPALVKRGDLSVGISTTGASPTAAVWLKQQVEGLITITAADADTPAGRAEALLNKLEQVLSMPLPWHKIGLAHLTGPKLGGGDPANHCEVLRLVKGERLTALFQKAAALGVGIELNTATFGFGNEAERQAVTAFYAHAKECGCRFFFGSDAHGPVHFTHHRPRGQRMADMLGLEERDIFRIK